MFHLKMSNRFLLIIGLLLPCYGFANCDNLINIDSISLSLKKSNLQSQRETYLKIQLKEAIEASDYYQALKNCSELSSFYGDLELLAQCYETDFIGFELANQINNQFYTAYFGSRLVDDLGTRILIEYISNPTKKPTNDVSNLERTYLKYTVLAIQYNQILSLDSNLYVLYCNMGNYKSAQGFPENEILSTYKTAEKHAYKAGIFPIDALVNLALTEEIMGNSKNAQRYFKNVETYIEEHYHEDDYRVLLIGKACSLTQIGEYKEAELLVQKSLEIDPFNFVITQKMEAYHLLYYLATFQEKYCEALQYNIVINTLIDGWVYNQNKIRTAEFKSEISLQQEELKIIKIEKKNIIDQNRMLNLIILVIIILALFLIAVAVLFVKNKNVRLSKISTELKNELLNEENFDKQLDLLKFAIYIKQKKEFLNLTQKSILNISRVSDQAQMRSELKSLNISLQHHSLLIGELDTYNKKITILTEKIKDKLADNFEKLSKSEIDLILYIKLGYASKEIAILKGVDHKSIDVARYRLKKKLNLKTEEKLNDFVERLNLF